MKIANFFANKDEGLLLDRELFQRIVVGAADRRIDDKERTGCATLIRELETENKNLCLNFVGAPSERAMFLVSEKSTRIYERDQVTSQDSEDEAEFWRGAISYKDGKQEFHSSCSGLLGSEDVVIAIIKLSRALGITINAVIENVIKRKGKLPKEIHEEGHYLYEILNEYGAKEMLQ